MPRGKRADKTPDAAKPQSTPVETPKIASTDRLNSALTDDERLALLHHHKRIVQRADVEIKDAADAVKEAKKERKNALALAVKECGDEADAEIADLILAETPQGEAALKATTARQIRVLQWSGAAPGTQFSFDDLRGQSPDPYSDGKLAGIRGDTAKPPHDPGAAAYERWMAGYHDGQGCLAAGFEKLKSMDDGAASPIVPDDDAGGDGGRQVDLEESIAAAADMPGSPPPPIDTSSPPFNPA